MENRRSYPIRIQLNGREITEVIIDAHYESKHPDINDELILNLVKDLDNKDFQAEEREDDWEFFMLDQIEHEGKLYRLVWCLRDEQLFIGVINCFRR